MKQFKEKKYFYPVVITGAVIIVLVILRFLGFRITYTEPNWNALSSWASWASVLASIFAVIAAIKIPKTIADRQDKIALFDKRLECYIAIQNLIACADQISSVTTNKAVQTAFRLWLDSKNNITEDISFSDLVVHLNQMKPVLVSGDFLFEKYDQKLLQNIINTGIDLTTQVASTNENESKSPLSEKAMRTKDEFCRLCTEFSTEYLDSMENELNLKIKIA